MSMYYPQETLRDLKKTEIKPEHLQVYPTPTHHQLVITQSAAGCVFHTYTPHSSPPLSPHHHKHSSLPPLFTLLPSPHTLRPTCTCTCISHPSLTSSPSHSLLLLPILYTTVLIHIFHSSFWMRGRETPPPPLFLHYHHINLTPLTPHNPPSPHPSLSPHPPPSTPLPISPPSTCSYQRRLPLRWLKRETRTETPSSRSTLRSWSVATTVHVIYMYMYMYMYIVLQWNPVVP